jgi:hypothetical protein
MAHKKFNFYVLISILIFVLTITALCNGNDDKGESVNNKKTPPDVELEKLYLSKYYLVPNQPGDDSTNKTEILAMNQSTFSHNIRDRKFNEKLKPKLKLWVDAHGKSGIKLEFEIGFQAVEDNTIIPNKNFKIIFPNYTTAGNQEPEYINLSFLKFDGEPFDIQPGADNWCSVYLTIKRTDELTNSKLQVYTGANGKNSYIIIPYDKTLSSFDQGAEDESGNTPGFEFETVVIAIFILITIYFYQSQSSKK